MSDLHVPCCDGTHNGVPHARRRCRHCEDLWPCDGHYAEKARAELDECRAVDAAHLKQATEYMLAFSRVQEDAARLAAYGNHSLTCPALAAALSSVVGHPGVKDVVYTAECTCGWAKALADHMALG